MKSMTWSTVDSETTVDYLETEKRMLVKTNEEIGILWDRILLNRVFQTLHITCFFFQIVFGKLDFFLNYFKNYSKNIVLPEFSLYIKVQKIYLYLLRR